MFGMRVGLTFFWAIVVIVIGSITAVLNFESLLKCTILPSPTREHTEPPETMIL